MKRDEELMEKERKVSTREREIALANRDILPPKLIEKFKKIKILENEHFFKNNFKILRFIKFEKNFVFTKYAYLK